MQPVIGDLEENGVGAMTYTNGQSITLNHGVLGSSPSALTKHTPCTRESVIERPGVVAAAWRAADGGASAADLDAHRLVLGRVVLANAEGLSRPHLRRAVARTRSELL